MKLTLTVPPEYRCDCGKAYSKKNSLYAHQKKYCCKEKQFKCPRCYYRSHTMYNIKRHLHSVHHCMVLFKVSSDFYRFILCVNKPLFSEMLCLCQVIFLEIRYRCFQCGRTYLRRQTLKRHLLYECGKEPKFKYYAARCPNCGHGYKHRSSLSKHIKWECGNAGQFKCRICSYTAKQKVNLIRHLKRVHDINMQDIVKLYL
nr:unnamed protein product [Callosobruchus chinensis]